jgi:ABC-type Na+ efflux pump permease subunit
MSAKLDALFDNLMPWELDDLGDNPIFRREVTPRAWRRSRPLVRRLLGVLALGLALAPAFWVVRHPQDYYAEIATGLVWCLAIVALVMMPSHTAQVIVRERAQRTWDAVLLTRLQPAEIFVGKLLAPYLQLQATALLVLPTVVALVVADPSRDQRSPELFASLAMASGVLVVGSLAAGAVGLWASLRSRTMSEAQAISLSLLALSLVPVYVGSLQGGIDSEAGAFWAWLLTIVAEGIFATLAFTGDFQRWSLRA